MKYSTLPHLHLVVIWIAWCALHSALISLSITDTLRKHYPIGFRYYRILYNLIAVATLIPVLRYMFSIKGEPLITWDGPWRSVPVLLGSAALILFAAGARRYDFLQFLGIRQIKGDSVCSLLTDNCVLDTQGVLSMVRHPWYSAGLLVVWARPLDLAAVLTNIVLSVYFVVGAILEERKLKARFGNQYADYQRRVSMFLPIKWVAQLLRIRQK